MTVQFRVNYPFTPPYERDIIPTPERISADGRFTGRGVVMAFVDAGFYGHPDIADRIKLHVDASTDAIIETPEVQNITMASWHGQMTSVIAAGNGSLSDGRYRGLASEAELILIKVSTPAMRLHENDILRGFEWVLQNHEQHGIRIVNVSVGGDYVAMIPSHPLHQAVREMVNVGLVVVVSSGNHGVKRLVPPASSPDAIVVGGYDDMNSFDEGEWRPYHSSYGYAYDTTTKPDLIAPARWVASPILPETVVEREAEWLIPLLHKDDAERDVYRILENARKIFELDDDTRYPTDKFCEYLQDRIDEHKLIHPHYQHVDGTSVSAPIVSSVIAQMLEANPRLKPQKIKMILKQTARPLHGMPPIRQGAGMVVAYRAVNAAVGAW